MVRQARAQAAAPVAAVLAALVLAACGGSQEPAELTPEARSAVGGYRLTTVIAESTLPDNPVGPDSEVSTEAFLSCADDACSALYQRASSTDRPQGNTVRLETRAGGFTGEHVRVGECGGSSHGTYGESFTWTWEAAADGVLTGTLEQVFRGCGIDGATTFTATATPDPDLALPYLPETQQRELAAAISAYDVNVAAVYVGGSDCDTDEGTTKKEAGCFSETFDGWQQDIAALAAGVRAVGGSASGSCRKAISALRLPAWSDVVGKAAVLYAQATGQGSIQSALQAEDAVTKVTTTEHAHLLTVAALCTDPRRVGDLGKDGLLDLDHGSVLPPLAP